MSADLSSGITAVIDPVTVFTPDRPDDRPDVYPSAARWQISHDGHLFVLDDADRALAVYAPSRWTHVDGWLGSRSVDELGELSNEY